MVSSELLDIVIGVVFAWFVLSLVVSLVGEAVAWALKTRAKLLWRSLGQLFDDGVDPATGMVRELASAARKDVRPVATEGAAPMVTVGVVAPGDATAAANVDALYDVVRRRVPDPAPKGRRTRISAVPGVVVADAFETLLMDRAGGGPPTMADVERLLAGNPALRDRIAAVATGLSGTELARQVRAEVERWFDGAMAGLTTFYRRQNRKLLAVIAVPVVLLANASAFSLYQRLQEDQDLRAAAGTAAAQWAAEPLTASGASLDLDAVCERITSDDADAGASATPASPGDPDPVAEARRRFQCAGDLFRSTDLLTPIGPKALVDELNAASSGGFARDVWSWATGDLLGRVVTWTALLFGASFWYDALRRLIGLRSAARRAGT